MSSFSHESTAFGEELAELSEAEVEERANKSVEGFYSHPDQEATEWRESILEQEAAESLEEFYSRTCGLYQEAADSRLGRRESILEQEAADAIDRHRELFKKSAEAHLENPDWMTKFGEFVDIEATQTGGTADTTLHSLFDDSQLGRAKGELLAIVAQNPDGVQFSEAARAVLGDGAVSDSTYEYKQLLEYVRGSEYVETSKNGGIWVEPALHLRPQYASLKTSVGRGDDTFDGDDRLEDRGDGGSGGLSNGDDHQENSDDGRADSPQYPKDRVRAVLEKYGMFRADNSKQTFLQELVTQLELVEDRWQALEHKSRDEYICIPYRLRHNDTAKAGNVRERYDHVFDAAARRHNRATMATLTTDPKLHDGLLGALDNLAESKNKFLQRLSTEYQLGYRPEYLAVLEFTESGIPHLHLVLFGVTPQTHECVSESAIASQWQKYGQGYVVDVGTAETIHDGSEWLLHDDEQGSVSLSYYLGKAIRGLEEIAEMDIADLRDLVDGGDTSLWRQVLYWATEKQYFSCSGSLKRPTADDDSGVSEWRFIGVAEYHNLPAHVREKARFVGIPPPTTSGTASRTGATTSPAD